MAKLTYVVIPNWNGKNQLPDCLKSLRAQTAKPHLIVVDNGSTDGSVEWLQRHAKEVVVIELDRNYGFAGGVNRGWQYALEAGADYVAVFNNDAVAEADWLANLAKRMQRSPKIGIVTGKILQKSKSNLIDSVGEAYSIWGQAFPEGRDQTDTGQFAAARQIFAASGAASLYRARLLKQIGFLDEDFFAYYEDVDLSFRARLAGWQVWYEPKAIVHHSVGATSGQLGNFRDYHRLKNTPMVYDKNLPRRLFWRYLPRKLMGLAAISSRMLLRGQGLAMLKALWYLALHAPAIMLKRRRIQQQRKVSDKSVDGWLYKAAPPTSRSLTRLSKIFDRKYQP